MHLDLNTACGSRRKPDSIEPSGTFFSHLIFALKDFDLYSGLIWAKVVDLERETGTTLLRGIITLKNPGMMPMGSTDCCRNAQRVGNDIDQNGFNVFTHQNSGCRQHLTPHRSGCTSTGVRDVRPPFAAQGE